MLLIKSDDKGKTWSKPVAVVDAHAPSMKQKISVQNGTLWTDPSGNLWFFFDQSMADFDGRAGIWYSICNNPNASQPQWSQPVRIWHGTTKSKPIVLSTGEWILPVSLLNRGIIDKEPGYYLDAYHELDSSELDHAKNILILPVVYALWVLISLAKAIRHKYSGDFSSADAKQEAIILFLSLSPWIGLPFISYFDLNQWMEACISNCGFLLLLAFHLIRHIVQIRVEHERLIESEKRLTTWNEQLQAEVEKRTRELERITSERRFEENSRQFNLTSREKEIAKLICEGYSYKEVGEELFIAERTVAKHVQNIFEKVRVSSKMELYHKLEKIVNSA